MSDSTANSTAADIGGSDLSNLYSVINRDSVYGLNLSVPEDAKAIIKPWDQREDTSQFIDSGVDDQVIIHIPFSQNVRIRSMILKIGRGESTPRRLRIYANHHTIVDFADAEETKPQLELSLLEGEVSATEYPLRVAAFASINTLSLFFVSSQYNFAQCIYLIVHHESHAVGDEVSRVYYIGFKGDTTSPRKDGTQKLEIPAANAADASLVDRVSEKAGSQQTTAR